MKPRKLIEAKPFRWIDPIHRNQVNQCDLTIHKRNAGAVIIATERIGDPEAGTSVTNGAEHIATAVMEKYRLNPNYMIWIEHYPAREKIPESFDLVQFNLEPEGHRLTKPRWVRIHESAVFALTEQYERALGALEDDCYYGGEVLGEDDAAFLNEMDRIAPGYSDKICSFLEVSEKIFQSGNGLEKQKHPFKYEIETLYRSPVKQWFLHCEGGSLSQYALPVADFMLAWETIKNLTPEEAQEWLQKHAGKDLPPPL